MTTLDTRYTEASTQTRAHLRAAVHAALDDGITPLELPDPDQLVDLIAKVAPAGDVPSVILNGLLRLPDRRLPAETVQKDINTLLRGVRQQLDRAVYGTFFAGPAAVIWAYQGLLRLAGKEPEDAFPEGTWQFYIDYALREDTARHTNETTGFDTLLTQYGHDLHQGDRLTAWVMSAVHTLHQYDALLTNEWRERVYCRVLRELTTGTPYANKARRIYPDWERLRPYRRGHDVAPGETYARYRQHKFDRFFEERIRIFPDEIQRGWLNGIATEKERNQPAYLDQMSIVATLQPGPHGEVRQPLLLRDAHIGLIVKGQYYLLPVCEPDGHRPVSVSTIRQQIHAILYTDPAGVPAGLTTLARVRRGALADLRQEFNPIVRDSLEALRTAPILLNADQQRDELPLAALRQTERGVGDHPLTLIDSGRSMLFDQSHIFFDGAWGAALAEIMTNEALSWGVYLGNSERPTVNPSAAPAPLTFPWQPEERRWLKDAPHVGIEVAAESEGVNLKAILSLRRLFKRRSDLINLTVNDLLVLYRAIHAATYQPNPQLVATLESLTEQSASAAAAKAALAALDVRNRINPAILIPIDATHANPRDRVFPICFEVPLHELDLLAMHRNAVANLNTYGAAFREPTLGYDRFDSIQRQYLTVLSAFGQLFSAARATGTQGKSAAVGTIKLLAHMPPSWQRLLNKIPNQFDLLNDLIRGQEVISNLGVVAAGSSLTRFTTAKDDNDKKTLTWGILTDVRGIMHISLRDFRPHVKQLVACGQGDVAQWMVEDYLTAYVQGLNDYIRDLRRITVASRETYTDAERVFDPTG